MATIKQKNIEKHRKIQNIKPSFFIDFKNIIEHFRKI